MWNANSRIHDLNIHSRINRDREYLFLLFFASIIWESMDPILFGCRCGVIVKVLDCEIVVSEFKLHSRYYLHFRTNPLILPAMG